MKGGTAYHRTADMHRLKLGNGGQGTRAPNLNRDPLEASLGLLCSKLVGNGPSWRLGRVAHLFTQIQLVQLDHRAIGFVVQLRSQRFQ